MLLIGLTGASGSGKSLVARELKRRGLTVFDADAIYHSLIAADTPCSRGLAKEFGEDILLSNGGIDRKRLAYIVFASAEDREARIERLNALTHHYVLEDVRLKLSLLRDVPAVVLDAPTLIESGFHTSCDVVIAVTASEDVRLARIMERDAIDRSAAQRRLEAQRPAAFYEAHADFVLQNDGTEEELLCRVESVWNQLFPPSEEEKRL